MNQPALPPTFPDFDLDSIREIAALLRESELGEICIETTGENAPAMRLHLRRAAAASAPAVFNSGASDASAPLPAGSTPEAESDLLPEVEPETPANIAVTSLAVGVFREAKVAVQVGDEIKARQVLGSVESLRVPNEVASPVAGKVVEVSGVDGQGVEYGQVLFVITEV